MKHSTLLLMASFAMAAQPRALIIGDSISIGYMEPVRALAKEMYDVHHNPGNAAHTGRGVEMVEKWVGSGPWSLIHFNFGLHDLRRMEDGKHQIAIDAYEANLRKIVAVLKKTGARLVWASTTPVPKGNLSPPRSDADVVAYNAVARKIMDQNGIDILDLYSLALPRLGEIQRAVNVHFTEEGSAELARHVVDFWRLVSKRPR